MRLTENDDLDALTGIEHLISQDEKAWWSRAKDFADRAVYPYVDDDFERQHLRTESMKHMALAGLIGMQFREASPTSYGLVCMETEAADSGWRTFLSVQGSLVMTAIDQFGSDEHKATWLPRIADGSTIGCFALTEERGGSDPASMSTYARRDGDDWIISGHKRWIGLGSVADIAIVWAATDEGIRGFVVDTSSAGFSATPITNKLSMRASVQADIVLDRCRVPASSLLPGVVGLGSALACLSEARFGIVWGAMGAARACIAAALQYAKTRESFGRPIAQTQLVQKKLADSAASYAMGVSYALHLSRLKEKGQLRPEQISIGKLRNVRAASEIAHNARSILAGEGITASYPVMRHLMNLESVQTYEGTDDIHILLIGRALTGLSAF